jgi:eukaryotic-like serine/threonine-protein kinase
LESLTLVLVKAGEQIAGRYRLLRPIGSGGMGEVWAARNELTNRDFAIKFLLTEFAHNEEAYERFVREAKTTGTLQHPSIIDVYDVAMNKDNRPFIVMELLHGEELESLIERRGSLSPLTTAAYFAQISAALQLAHEAGVVHRDLSTNNIFLARSEDGAIVPKILDFGVSKTMGPLFEGQSVTLNGAVLGNPIFMSPEQARGAGQVDARTDVWALGVGMYQSITGTAPFHSRNYNALMVDIITRPHRPILELVPTLDAELAAVIEACLQKDRDRRLQSSEELSLRLSGIARRLSSDPELLGRSPRRRATDRLPSERATRQSLADSGMPWFLRMWTLLGIPAPTRGVIGFAAVLAGVALGFSAARHLERPAPVIIQAAAPVAPAAPAPKARQVYVAPPASTQSMPVGKTQDLRSAVARGLEDKAPSGTAR